MAITEAKLPYKKGFVEIERDGERVYKQIEQVTSERVSLLEDCIAELAVQVYQ